ncbi:MAG: hypothetical protein RLN70_08345 [Rhodospirillaceae bacterium]
MFIYGAAGIEVLSADADSLPDIIGERRGPGVGVMYLKCDSA